MVCLAERIDGVSRLIQLTKTLAAWGTPDFENILKMEIEEMNGDQLPLQQGLSASSYALDNHLKAIIMNVSKDEGFIHVKAGIFYTGIISGCNCADDPTPVEEQPEYCEVQLDINASTAETRISLAGDQGVGS